MPKQAGLNHGSKAMYFAATVLSFFLAFAMAAEAPLLNTLDCFSSGRKTTIGGASTETGLVLDCPSCENQQFCDSDNGYCFWLSTSNVYVFLDGQLVETLPILEQCLPIEITEIFDGEYAIHCVSQTPGYGPKFQPFFLVVQSFETISELSGYGVHEPSSFQFAQLANNFQLVASVEGFHFVSILRSGNALLFKLGDDYTKTISNCRNITRITKGETIDHIINLIVDCESTEGQWISLKVSQRLDNYEANPTIEQLPISLEGGDVKLTKGNQFIVHTTSSTVSFIKTSQLTHTPGVLRFDGITETILTTDNELIIVINGQNLVQVVLSEYFDSNFQSGVSEIPQTVPNCPGGKCNPIVFHNGSLFTFTRDPDSIDYSLLVQSDLQSPPLKIARVLSSETYDACFPVFAEIPTLPPAIDSVSTGSEASDPGRNNAGYLSPEIIIVIVAVVVLMALVVVCLIIVCCCCCSKKRDFCCKKWPCKSSSFPIQERNSGKDLENAYGLPPSSSQLSSKASSYAEILHVGKRSPSPTKKGGSQLDSETSSISSQAKSESPSQPESIEGHSYSGRRDAKVC